MKLKTLKDLRFEDIHDVRGEEVVDYLVSEKELREEAIKWIKEDLEVARKQEIGVDTKMLIACMKWANRFNITEEDLK